MTPEDRLSRLLEDAAHAHTPVDGLDMIRRRAARRQPGAGWLAAGVAILLVVGIVASRLLGSGGQNVVSPISNLGIGSLLTVYESGSGGSVLQLRSTVNGSVEKTLLRSVGDITAVRTQDGRVLAGVSVGRCGTSLETIDPVTDHASGVMVIPTPLSAMALSPDGTKVAYLVGGCSQAQFPSNVLVLRDLLTGATRTSVAPEYSTLATPSWNPSSTEIAVSYASASNVPTYEILIFNGADPSFARAARLSPPQGCGWPAAVWTVNGIVAIQGCGSTDPRMSPQSLVQVNAKGAVTQSWALPKCIDGATPVADPTLTHVLVRAVVGYGGCEVGGGLTSYDELLAVDGKTLPKIASFPENGGMIESATW